MHALTSGVIVPCEVALNTLGVCSCFQACRRGFMALLKNLRHYLVDRLFLSSFQRGGQDMEMGRLVKIILVLAILGLIQCMLPAIWSAILSCKVVHHDTFEAFLSVLCFYVWTHLWIFIYGLTRPQGVSSREWKDFHFSEIRLLLVASSYYLSIWAFHTLVRARRPLDASPPSALRVAAELACGIWAYDFIFFWIHRAMHRYSLSFHQLHHSVRDVMPWHVANHDALDAFLQVFVNVLVQQYGPFGVKHDLSRLLHNILITYMLVEIHTPVEAPFSLHRLCPALFGGSKFHLAHHRDGRYHHQQFFFYLDACFGTLSPGDEKAVAAHPASDKPGNKVGATKLGKEEEAHDSIGFWTMDALWTGSLLAAFYGMSNGFL
eukprot:g6740.t1